MKNFDSAAKYKLNKKVVTRFAKLTVSRDTTEPKTSSWPCMVQVPTGFDTLLSAFNH